MTKVTGVRDSACTLVMDGIRNLRSDLSIPERFIRCFGNPAVSVFFSGVFLVTDEGVHDHGVHRVDSGKGIAKQDEPPTLRLIEQPLFWRTRPAEGPDNLIEKERLYVCSYS